jgi:hypothetical protein
MTQPDWMPQGVLPVLGEHDGKAVLSTGIKVTNAGDGLSKALAIEPVQLHHGQKVVIVMETEVDQIAYKPVKDTDGVQRLHTLKAGTATIIDAAIVREALEAQAAKNATAAELARGERKLPTADALKAEHDIGDHAGGLIPGCPACDDEVRVKEAEAADEAGELPAPRPIGSRRRGAS